MLKKQLAVCFIVSVFSLGISGCGGGGNGSDDSNSVGSGIDDGAGVAGAGGPGTGPELTTNPVCALPAPDCDAGYIRNIDAEGPTMCVALRGNGDRIPSHFAGMARIFEKHGMISGVAGGSSAAFTALLIESAQKNAGVQCEHCSAREKGERAALLMKSMFGYINTISDSEDFIAAQSIAALLGEIQSSGLDQDLETGSLAATEEFQTLLNSDRFRSLVNPEVFQLLNQSPDPAFHGSDLFNGLQVAVAFDSSDSNILVRPGLLNVDGLGEQIGLAADFYVEADLEQFLSECSDQSVGKSWPEIVSLPATEGSCGSLFDIPLNSYLQRRTPSSQLNQPLGEFMHTIISTSVLEGESVGLWNDAETAYWRAEPIAPNYNFADVQFAYFGASEDLQVISENRNSYSDEKTRRFRAYPDVTWREALRYSPAEPGLSKALTLPDARISVGGWNDLHPVQVLKNLGCDKVIYLTRQGEESRFARGISNQLGSQPEDEAALFDLNQSESGFSRALEEADGVWCTNWNLPARLDFAAFYDDAYNAPFQTTDPELQSIPYFNTQANVGLAGCTVGVY